MGSYGFTTSAGGGSEKEFIGFYPESSFVNSGQTYTQSPASPKSLLLNPKALKSKA